MQTDDPTQQLGVLIVGVAGAVATTAIAGIEMIKAGSNTLNGLPLASRHARGMCAYRSITFGGWDVTSETLDIPARKHGILSDAELADGAGALSSMRPWPAVGNPGNGSRNGERRTASGHRAAIAAIQADIARFRRETGIDRVVMINLASTERISDANVPAFQSIESLERALDTDDAAVGPALLYAYAAITADTPYANFTPSLAADAKPLARLAEVRNVPIGGKDGKTGQTLLKSVIAPALRERALHVDGWFSTNILGNSDGRTLDDPQSLAAKVATKKDALEQILGYPVEDHIVMIHYYPPRGDDKEAWDNIDVTGFLGRRMQIKVNMLCKDSVLAAPLVIEIARLLDLARQHGEGGVQEQLGVFFKSPQTRSGGAAEHSFAVQQARLDQWLARLA